MTFLKGYVLGLGVAAGLVTVYLALLMVRSFLESARHPQEEDAQVIPLQDSTQSGGDRCRSCDHTRIMHLDGHGCLYGKHPQRHQPGWEEYRETYPACRCSAFEEEPHG